MGMDMMSSTDYDTYSKIIVKKAYGVESIYADDSFFSVPLDGGEGVCFGDLVVISANFERGGDKEVRESTCMRS